MEKIYSQVGNFFSQMSLMTDLLQEITSKVATHLVTVW